MKTLLTALALTVLPGLAMAEGCAFGHTETASMSCAEGMTFDATTGTCVATTS